MRAHDEAGVLSRYVATTIVFFCSWIFLTSTVFDEFLAGTSPTGGALQEIVAAAILSLVLAVWGYPYMSARGLSVFSPKRIVWIIFYIPVFFYECLKANLDVAYRVVHPKMPIKPGIVAIRTCLKSDVGKLALANSITLTPGTLTLDLTEEYLFIHWISVESTDVEEAGRLIGGRFEKYLKVITE
jgi:multicomponent Na+:H+ antiporter subunit E